MKLTIKELTQAQKAVMEVMKLPMKWKTATTFNDFLVEADKVLSKALEDFQYENKKQELFNQFTEEVVAEIDKKVEGGDTRPREEIAKELLGQVEASKAYEAEVQMKAELEAIEVEMSEITYVLDETLPAIFNIALSNKAFPIIKFKQRDTKKA